MSQPSKEEPKQGENFPRREEFQKYLEKAGVIDQLTRLLVNLYENPDKPENALDYIRNFLGATSAVPAGDESSKPNLQSRVDELEKEAQTKDARIAELESQLASLQQSGGDAEEQTFEE